MTISVMSYKEFQNLRGYNKLPEVYMYKSLEYVLEILNDIDIKCKIFYGVETLKHLAWVIVRLNYQSLELLEFEPLVNPDYIISNSIDKIFILGD